MRDRNTLITIYSYKCVFYMCMYSTKLIENLQKNWKTLWNFIV